MERKLMKMGRSWAALRTVLYSMTEVAYKLRACGVHGENTLR